MISRRLLIRVLMLTTLIALPRTGFAQEAVLTGTITDSSGGVLPGVTITAVHTGAHGAVRNQGGVLSRTEFARTLPRRRPGH